MNSTFSYIKRKVFELSNPTTEAQLKLALKKGINDVNLNHPQFISNAFQGFIVSMTSIYKF